jgi:hypothetical protein
VFGCLDIKQKTKLSESGRVSCYTRVHEQPKRSGNADKVEPSQTDAVVPIPENKGVRREMKVKLHFNTR